MENAIMNHEREVIGCLQSVLLRYSDRFQELKLVPKIDELRRSNVGSSNYFSEIAVYFKDDTNDLIDIIEFFIYRDGKRVSSIQETETWLEEVIHDVQQRRRKAMER